MTYLIHNFDSENLHYDSIQTNNKFIDVYDKIHLHFAVPSGLRFSNAFAITAIKNMMKYNPKYA